ncbi:MAG: hypothetical protein KGD64_06925 [Candidatus Heimdallarchaeota archaeon]|nr:hypothetical protein [Candidatus Heimdallarchaeota archaeon]
MDRSTTRYEQEQEKLGVKSHHPIVSKILPELVEHPDWNYNGIFFLKS